MNQNRHLSLEHLKSIDQDLRRSKYISKRWQQNTIWTKKRASPKLTLSESLTYYHLMSWPESLKDETVWSMFECNIRHKHTQLKLSDQRNYNRTKTKIFLANCNAYANWGIFHQHRDKQNTKNLCKYRHKLCVCVFKRIIQTYRCGTARLQFETIPSCCCSLNMIFYLKMVGSMTWIKYTHNLPTFSM